MKKNLYKEAWEKGMSYEAYRSLVDDLLTQGKTTGVDQSAKMVEYTQLNVQRMKRIDKTLKLNVDLNDLKQDWIMLTITEGWCGDAAQIVPVTERVAQELGIESRYILRDENMQIMDLHLTNGSRSIPKVILLDTNDYSVIAPFGPRPSELQSKVVAYRSMPEPKPPYPEFSKKVQLWYAKDKQRAIQREFMTMLSSAIADVA